MYISPSIFELKGSTVVIYCDTLTSGCSWDEFLDTVARNIWLITASHAIELSVFHVPGKENGLADSLSRWYGGGLTREVVDNLLSYQWCDMDNEIISINNII